MSFFFGISLLAEVQSSGPVQIYGTSLPERSGRAEGLGSPTQAIEGGSKGEATQDRCPESEPQGSQSLSRTRLG